MRADLTAILACPGCGGPLGLSFSGEERPAPEEEVTQGGLVCPACDRDWPIVRGIPRLLPEGVPQEVLETGGRFGYEWTVYPELHSFYDEQFLAWIGPARREDFRGRRVLDAGCGKGRHLALAHRYGARSVLGVDVGVAVEAARANTRDLDGVEVVQADLLGLPINERFDLIYCVGVLHHLPDPAEGFRKLASLLAPGGRIHVWVYGHEGNGWIRLLFDPMRRLLFRRLPPALIRPLAWIAAAPLYGISHLYALAERRLPGLYRRLFYREYLTFLAGLPYRDVFWIVFDQMVAPTTHYIRREEVEDWLKGAGLEDPLVSSLRGMSWRGSGRAPGEGRAGP